MDSPADVIESKLIEFHKKYPEVWLSAREVKGDLDYSQKSTNRALKVLYDRSIVMRRYSKGTYQYIYNPYQQ